MTRPKPFEVRWREAEVEAVLGRVRVYPWPPAPEVADGWAYGCDGGYLRALCEHWTQRYDWRAAVADLNRFPQFTARVEDFDLHFLHVVGEAVDVTGWLGGYNFQWAWASGVACGRAMAAGDKNRAG